MHHSDPVLIAPECYAPGCHHDGDQYTMVKCRSCGHWFCAEHFTGEDEGRGIALVDSGLRGLSYYLGLCARCRERQQVRHAANSTWLR